MPRQEHVVRAIAFAFAAISSAAAITGIFAVVTTFSLPACSLNDSEGGACPSVTGNPGGGETACGTSTCEEGNYCASDAGGGCAPGCMVTAQCPFGDYCDMTSAKPDLEGNLVGDCTHPTLQQQSGGDCGTSSSDASASSSKDAAK